MNRENIDRPLEGSDYDLIEAAFARLVFTDPKTGSLAETLAQVSDGIRRCRERYVAAATAKLEGRVKELEELLDDVLCGSVDARTYPDGPSLEKELRDRIRAALNTDKKEIKL